MTTSPPPRSRRPSNPSHNRTTSFTPSLRRRNTAHSIQSDTSLDAEVAEATHTSHAIVEEIAQLKRYEDFTTIDWVQDAAREQLRRKARRNKRFEYGNNTRSKSGKLRRTIAEAYDAGQAWIVVTLVGAAIGLNAAFLNIVTEWLSDIKLGHCTTAFYLNESFCCWGAEGGCEEWKHWSGFWPVNYVLYICFAALFSFTAARLVKSFAPYAAGSGISEMKCIIAGFVMKGFLGATTLFIKSIGLPLAIASGLSVGKEGPSVHYAVCTGNVISRFFDKYRRNAAKTREILSASAAAGVGVAFGSPIGGVLFSLEEMSNYFPLKTLWRSYFCALVATAVLAAMNPFRTGQLVMFQVKYDRGWHFFETLFYLVIGIFGGLYGAFVIKWNLKMQVFRKKYLAAWPITEAVTLAVFTAIICYPNMFLRIDMTESMEILFQECEGGHDYNRLCDRDQRWHMIGSLAIAAVIRTLLVVISFGCKVPAGIFVPSMAVGAAFGRMVGIFVQHIHESYPASPFFSACEPDGPCITPGTYAFLGAAAALGGIMHISISVVVIMFEITGALTYILPTMIVVGVTKFVSERFGHGGIADRMIYLNGYPFLDSKEEHTFGVPVSQVMASHATCLPATGMELRAMERIINENQFQGYPVVEDLKSKILVGYVGRTELKYALEKARAEGIGRGTNIYFTTASAPQSKIAVSSHAGVPGASTTSASAAAAGPSRRSTDNQPSSSFSSPANSSSIPPHSSSTTSPPIPLDFSRYIDPTPLTVHPRLPLETVMELFKKMGPRVILIEYRGRLTGLVTVKDCLKYQVKVEASHGHGSGEADEDEGMARLYGYVRAVAVRIDAVFGTVVSKVGLGGLRGGEVRLVSPVVGDRGWVRREREEVFGVGGDDDDDEEGEGNAASGSRSRGHGVELEDRSRGR